MESVVYKINKHYSIFLTFWLPLQFLAGLASYFLFSFENNNDESKQNIPLNDNIRARCIQWVQATQQHCTRLFAVSAALSEP